MKTNFKKILLSLFLCVMTGVLFADDGCIIVTETKLPYTNQRWFYSGSRNPLQEDRIKSNWNEDYRITSAAHTSNGWFLVMSAGSGIGAQSYSYKASWPTDWTNQKWAEGYQLTQVSYGQGKWLVVMSKGTGITSQKSAFASGAELTDFVEKYWNLDYRITAAAPYNGKWYVVMSKGSGIGAQKYSFRDSYSGFSSKVKQAWDEGYFLSLAEIDASGTYFIVMSKYSDGHTITQGYNVNPSNVGTAISAQWNAGRNVSYIGGGLAGGTSSNAAARTSTTTKNISEQPAGDRYYCFDLGMGGKMHMWQHPNGSCTITQNMRCHACMGSLKCNICFGTGNAYAAIGRYMACPSCMGTGRCSTCGGTGYTSVTKTWQPGEAEAYLEANRAVKNQYRSQSSAHERRGNDYVESIYYTPNYTGKPYADEYCEKCGKWAQPHKHIKKRY